MRLLRIATGLLLSLSACGASTSSTPAAGRPPSEVSAPGEIVRSNEPLLEVTLKMQPTKDDEWPQVDCVTLRASGADNPPREICTDVEPGNIVPLFRQEQLTVTHRPPTVLLLGWGKLLRTESTVHAWIVRAETGKAPVVVDKVAWTENRTVASGLVIDERTKLRLGVPWTVDGPASADDTPRFEVGSREPASGSRDPWYDRWLGLPEEMKTLSSEKTTSTLPFYGPSTGNSRETRPAGTRVVWLDVTESGFVGQPVSRARRRSTL